MKLTYLPLVGGLKEAYNKLASREIGFYPTHFELDKYEGKAVLSLCGEENYGISEVVE